MSPCPHCREAGEELQEEVRQLKALLAGDREIIPAPLRCLLTDAEKQVLRLLLARPALTPEAYIAVRNTDLDVWSHSDVRKLLNVYAYKLRNKLFPFGIEIETRWGGGYALDPAMKARIRAMSDEAVAA